MITMNELVDLRMQQQIAHEIFYRQQIMQRIPDPFAGIMPSTLHLPHHHHHHMLVPQHPPLPAAVEAKLENNDLWQQFHKIGTEMIITKCGRRMFPSMRVSLKGLEDDAQYCVVVEMLPIGDCRFKFSGSQWIPAGGAEPQSPQRMYLHPDSPATGSHWQAQPILFNKVKLTNNTLDNNGHTVLASMHKYQPRIHVILTSDLSQIPWAPQKAFVFPETEFVAVTAYQNDRITKLKIDNNPFAKGFRESGQSKCKRKMSLSPPLADEHRTNNSPSLGSTEDDDQVSVASSHESPQQKRLCLREEASPSLLPYMDLNSVMRYTLPTPINEIMPPGGGVFLPHIPPMFMPTLPGYGLESLPATRINFPYAPNITTTDYEYISCNEETSSQMSSVAHDEQNSELFVDVVSTTASEESHGSEQRVVATTPTVSPSMPTTTASPLLLSTDNSVVQPTSFSITSILANNRRNSVSV